ncbi:UNVERIFIED_CONTAM: protein TRACHEARY ELEMENT DIFFERENTIATION-RELATED 6 [Sesamum angustifolium]|uniref:Protein TRACHEARY ELEMENT DIFFERENTIATION-RELATED 6 n=1 Tax=Sesamum angustifolium TaxID=2727405 RepID=A0AAW2L4V8_9LAMI
MLFHHHHHSAQSPHLLMSFHRRLHCLRQRSHCNRVHFTVAFCLFALWFKKRKKKAVQETEIIRTDKHLRVKEAIVEGPHGPETVVLSIEEDKHTEEEIVKNEKVEGKDMVSKSGQTTVTDPVAGESSSKPRFHQTHHLLEQELKRMLQLSDFN